MKTLFSKIAAVIALLIGLMAIFAGGQVVVLGIQPDYYVIDWLLMYNFIMGIITALITAVLIWRNHRLALPAAITTFGLHTAVMLILQTAYSQVVATDSIRAMTVRMTVWAIILVLLFVQAAKNKKQLSV